MYMHDHFQTVICCNINVLIYMSFGPAIYPPIPQLPSNVNSIIKLDIFPNHLLYCIMNHTLNSYNFPKFWLKVRMLWYFKILDTKYSREKRG